MAQGNWWGGVPNSSMFLVFSGGYLNYSSYLSSDPWAGIPLPSAAPAPGGNGIRVATAAAKLNSTPSSDAGPASAVSDDAVQPGAVDSLLPGIDLLWSAEQ